MRDDLERKLELTRRILRHHHAGVGPDAGFVARVTARLPAPPDPLRWAAARLLPAGLALALVLGVLVLRELPAGDGEPATVGELAAWIVGPAGEGAP